MTQSGRLTADWPWQGLDFYIVIIQPGYGFTKYHSDELLPIAIVLAIFVFLRILICY